MPKVGVTKTPKTFTLSISTLAWLDEYCIKSGKKMSPVVDGLINNLRKELERKAPIQYWCTPCGKDTDRIRIDNEPVCAVCKAVDQSLLHAMKLYK
tara:strand:+ start:139 stop:426 length:288 start_codon:yes stop_codon:yes gene_type:complete